MLVACLVVAQGVAASDCPPPPPQRAIPENTLSEPRGTLRLYTAVRDIPAGLELSSRQLVKRYIQLAPVSRSKIERGRRLVARIQSLQNVVTLRAIKSGETIYRDLLSPPSVVSQETRTLERSLKFRELQLRVRCDPAFVRTGSEDWLRIGVIDIRTSRSTMEWYPRFLGMTPASRKGEFIVRVNVVCGSDEERQLARYDRSRRLLRQVAWQRPSRWSDCGLRFGPE